MTTLLDEIEALKLSILDLLTQADHLATYATEDLYEWHYYTGKQTDPLKLTIGSYNEIPPLSWIPDTDGQGMVLGYVKTSYRLKAGYLAGKVRRQLVRAAWEGEEEDPTWYDDQALIRLGSDQKDLDSESGDQDWLFWLPPWAGEIENGRKLSVELKPSSEFASMTVTTRYLKAFVLNRLG